MGHVGVGHGVRWQEDIFSATSTPFEALMFIANLKLGPGVPRRCGTRQARDGPLGSSARPRDSPDHACNSTSPGV